MNAAIWFVFGVTVVMCAIVFFICLGVIHDNQKLKAEVEGLKKQYLQTMNGMERIMKSANEAGAKMDQIQRVLVEIIRQATAQIKGKPN